MYNIYEGKERYRPNTMPISSQYMTFDLLSIVVSYIFYVYEFAFETNEMEMKCIQNLHITWI